MFKSLNKGISTPIAITIIAVCAVLTGLIAWQYGLIPEISWEKIPKEVTPEDETADWEIYRNEKYGFGFKYPGDANFDSVDYTDPDDLRRHNIDPEYSAGDLLLTVRFSFTNKSDYLCASYIIDVREAGYQDVNNWVEDMRQRIETPSNYEGEMISGKLSLVEDMEIQGKIAKKVIIEGGYPFMNAYLGVINNDKLYTVSYLDMSSYERPGCFEGDVEQGEAKYKHIFDKLLSTFRFLE